MVLFCSTHLMNLYQFLTLKCMRYEEQEVVLLTKNDFAESTYARNMVESGLFAKIISHVELLHKKEAQTWEEIIEKYYDNIFEKNNLDLDAFSEIYITCDCINNFYLYCTFKKRNVIFVESFEGQFKDRHRYKVLTEFWNGSFEYEKLTEKFNSLSGEGENVVKRYLYGSEERVIDDKDEIVPFLDCFYSIPDSFKTRILDVFEIDRESYTNILLLNSYRYSIPKSCVQEIYHYLPYWLLADYYFSESDVLYIKDHPMTSKDLFNKAYKLDKVVMKADIPIEFYALCDDFYVENLVSVNSTGNNKIARFVKNEISLGDSYLWNFRLLHKLFATYAIDEYLGRSRFYHIYGVNKEFVTNFKNTVFLPFEEKQPYNISTKILKGNIFCVIDEIPETEIDNIGIALLNADANTKVVFLDSCKKRKFITCNYPELLEFIVPIEIKKKKLREDTLSDTEIEIIYFFCKDEGIRDTLSHFSVEKTLIYTGIKISIAVLNEGNKLDEMQNWKISLLEKQNKQQQYEIDELKSVILDFMSSVAEISNKYNCNISKEENNNEQ